MSEPEGRGADWTEERGTSDEGRRRLKAPRRRAGNAVRGQMRHLDSDVLAEFRAGLITGRRGARITAHLAGCDRCRALDDQLAGVSALLASVPAPAMPDSVAQRLDTVLAAEVAARAEAAGRDDPERPGSDRSRARKAHGHRAAHRGFRPLALRVLAPVAVVVLAAGGYGLSRLASPGGQMTASSSAGSAAALGRPSSTAASANRAASGAEAPVASAVPSPLKGAAGLPRYTAANFPFVASGTNFSSNQAIRKQQVENDLRVPLASRLSQAPSLAVRGCVRNLAGDHPVLLVESAFFEGRPATLIVAQTGQGETAWIAGPGCSATSRDVLATTSV
jgi:hypothetical protein